VTDPRRRNTVRVERFLPAAHVPLVQRRRRPRRATSGGTGAGRRSFTAAGAGHETFERRGGGEITGAASPFTSITTIRMPCWTTYVRDEFGRRFNQVSNCPFSNLRRGEMWAEEDGGSTWAHGPSRRHSPGGGVPTGARPAHTVASRWSAVGRRTTQRRGAASPPGAGRTTAVSAAAGMETCGRGGGAESWCVSCWACG